MESANYKHGRTWAPIAFVLLMIGTLCLWDSRGQANSHEGAQTTTPSPEDTISFFMTVGPDSFDTGSTARIGPDPGKVDDINAAIRPAGGKLFIVTAITAYHISPRSQDPFSIVSLTALTDKGSTRGWGGGGISVSGQQTTHAQYWPGIVVQLVDNESLSVRSFVQSTDTVRFIVHGYLVDRP